MKTLCLGIALGAVASVLVAEAYGINWGSAALCLVGSVACFVVWAILRTRKSRAAVNKSIGCILIATFAVSPWSIVLAEDTYAGYTGSSCYCLEQDIRAAGAPETEVENAMCLQFVVDAPDVPVPLAYEATPRIVSVRRPDPSTLVSWSEIASIFATEGIDLNSPNTTQYAKNGKPVSSAEVPFMLNQSFAEKLIWHPEQQQYRVVIETTSDISGEFSSWQAVARFSIPANTMIQYQDTPDGNRAFYRVRLDTAPASQIQPAAGAIVLGCGLGLLAGVAVISVLTVRACARNKKKFEKIQAGTNTTQNLQFEFGPVR